MQPVTDAHEFLIHVEICDSDPVEQKNVVQVIESHGESETADGFAFPTARRRDAVLEILGDRFGERYFRWAGTREYRVIHKHSANRAR